MIQLKSPINLSKYRDLFFDLDFNYLMRHYISVRAISDTSEAFYICETSPITISIL